MELRHVFLIAFIISISIFVIPTVYPLFTGQHSFYDTKSDNDMSDISCEKCHSDIREELDSSSSTYHASFKCENCHVLEISSNLTHGNVAKLRCLDCHGGSSPKGPIAKIFGENNVTNKESHVPFVESANKALLLKGENEACISCHTKKSLIIKMLYADIYKFNAERFDGWQLSDYSKNAEFDSPLLIQSTDSHGQHSFPDISQLKCEKCHSNIRDHLDNSVHHGTFSCIYCHQIYSSFHASSTPSCLECHRGPDAPVAPVYGTNESGADAHIPFVLSADKSGVSTGSSPACSSCHSSFNNSISIIRPSFIEWDVIRSGGCGNEINETKNETNEKNEINETNETGIWKIENLKFGPNKEIKVTKYLDGKIHNILDLSKVNCVSCHEDIEQAVIDGGHSNINRHNYKKYTDMNSYCKSCHKPVTSGTSEYPFTSPIHSSIKISCVDCHCKSDLYADINSGWEIPLPRESHKGGIEISIREQHLFTQSYLCIACKNTGNPKPKCNQSLHFKILTEPEVNIYVDGVQKYP